MQKKKIIGGLMFFVGVVLILNSLSGITGFVIAESIGKGVGSILGLVLVVGGVLVFIGGGGSLDDYFEKRVKEITKYKGTDEWIAQWEFNGVQNKLKEKGIGIRGPEKHCGGMTGPNIRHLNLQGYNKKGNYIDKHLFITPDINDNHLYETYKGDKPKKLMNKKQVKQYEKIYKKIKEIMPRINLFKKTSYNSKKRFLRYD